MNNYATDSALDVAMTQLYKDDDEEYSRNLNKPIIRDERPTSPKKPRLVFDAVEVPMLRSLPIPPANYKSGAKTECPEPSEMEIQEKIDKLKVVSSNFMSIKEYVGSYYINFRDSTRSSRPMTLVFGSILLTPEALVVAQAEVSGFLHVNDLRCVTTQASYFYTRVASMRSCLSNPRQFVVHHLVNNLAVFCVEE
jgi:hypothetical protein